MGISGCILLPLSSGNPLYPGTFVIDSACVLAMSVPMPQMSNFGSSWTDVWVRDSLALMSSLVTGTAGTFVIGNSPDFTCSACVLAMSVPMPQMSNCGSSWTDVWVTDSLAWLSCSTCVFAMSFLA